MPTTYTDREDEFDLGDGHSFVWFTDEEGVFGLIEHHPPTDAAASKGALYCGGYVTWRETVNAKTVPKHVLESGGPGEEHSVTLSPSLQCRHCSNHGYIRNGRWESV